MFCLVLLRCMPMYASLQLVQNLSTSIHFLNLHLQCRPILKPGDCDWPTYLEKKH